MIGTTLLLTITIIGLRSCVTRERMHMINVNTCIETEPIITDPN